MTTTMIDTSREHSSAEFQVIQEDAGFVKALLPFQERQRGGSRFNTPFQAKIMARLASCFELLESLLPNLLGFLTQMVVGRPVGTEELLKELRCAWLFGDLTTATTRRSKPESV
mmetsp:Transcript_43809/g.103053  ORF Transcript_43809/g.103053 Transcript_43809/m.103053 type:complete len:114 (-) Transcript_43809:60-401(-)